MSRTGIVVLPAIVVICALTASFVLLLDRAPVVNTINAQLNTNIQVNDLPDSLVVIKRGQMPSISGWAA